MASTQHGTAGYGPASGPAFGDCEQQQNPNPQAETMRALWVAFTAWVKDGVQPPPSSIPQVKDGTFVPPEQVRFPSIPANSYANQSPAGPAAPTARPAVRWQQIVTPLHVLDFGPLFNGLDESGVITKEPPSESAAQYGVLVPQVDADGNDLAGVRSTRLQAPLATHTGWNMGRQGGSRMASAASRVRTCPSRRSGRSGSRRAMCARPSRSGTRTTTGMWPPSLASSRSVSCCPKTRRGSSPRHRRARCSSASEALDWNGRARS